MSLKSKSILVFILLSTCIFGYSNIDEDLSTLFQIVPRYIKIEEDTVDMLKVLQMTAMVESRYGMDKYNVSHAKTFMQIEKATGESYPRSEKKLVSLIENRLGRKIQWNRNKDAIFISYIIYSSKIKHHKSWWKKLVRYKRNNPEWYVYKIYWNSILGATTYKKYKEREKELMVR